MPTVETLRYMLQKLSWLGMTLVLTCNRILGGLARAHARGWGQPHPSLTLIFYKNFITCAKEINCFHILLLVNLST